MQEVGNQTLGERVSRRRRLAREKLDNQSISQWETEARSQSVTGIIMLIGRVVLRGGPKKKSAEFGSNLSLLRRWW